MLKRAKENLEGEGLPVKYRDTFLFIYDRRQPPIFYIKGGATGISTVSMVDLDDKSINLATGNYADFTTLSNYDWYEYFDYAFLTFVGATFF